MPDTPIPTKGKRAHHKEMTLQHTSSVPDREDVAALSDFDLIDRLNIQMKAKQIPSDAASTARSATPIPTHFPAKYFPSRPFRV